MTRLIGLPQLDIFTLSEHWAQGVAMDAVWAEIGTTLGARPSDWRDDEGRRIYAAVLAFAMETDLTRPAREEQVLTRTTRLTAIRKPHAVAETVFAADGHPVMSLWHLVSLIRRDLPGSNKKLSKVRGVWQAEDMEPARVDDWLARHHAAKGAQLSGPPVLTHEANRLVDFNAADLFYFRNFVQLSRAAEWRFGRGQPPRLAARREGWFFGNVDDGDLMQARVARVGDLMRCEITREDGALLFLSQSVTPPVAIPPR